MWQQLSSILGLIAIIAVFGFCMMVGVALFQFDPSHPRDRQRGPELPRDTHQENINA